MLNADAANLFRINSLITGRFSSVASQGSWAGSFGGSSRGGQEHFSVPGCIMPVFVHWLMALSLLAMFAMPELGGHDPIWGKSVGMT